MELSQHACAIVQRASIYHFKRCKFSKCQKGVKVSIVGNDSCVDAFNCHVIQNFARAMTLEKGAHLTAEECMSSGNKVVEFLGLKYCDGAHMVHTQA